MDDAPRSAITLDLLGVALMVLGIGLGLLIRATLPAADECRDLGAWPPTLLSASVASFAFGFVRCLEGRARRIGWYAAAFISLLVLVGVFLATSRVGQRDCGPPTVESASSQVTALERLVA